jgi:deoxyribonuclease-4
MVDILIRKKILKIQERLGMRIGIIYGTTKIPTVRNLQQTLEVLRSMYKIGLKAFVLPKELFADISEPSDIYKIKYGDLLKIKEEAKRYNIQLALRHDSLSEQPDDTLKIFTALSSIMDCRTLIISPDFYSRIMPKDQALKLTVYKINEIIKESGTRGSIGIETTGKIDDVGSLEDVVDIVKRTKSTEPVLNWAHIHARGSGALRERKDFGSILSIVRQNIGHSFVQDAYFLFSGISYGPSGEIKHIPLSQSDINLEYMIRESMAMGIKGTLIFEDPGREEFILRIMNKLADMVR